MLLIIACIPFFETLRITEYEVDTNLAEDIRIVHLSDLHNKEYGDDNARFIGIVRSQSPDIIVCSGDMINGYDDSIDSVTRFISELSRIAPVYYGYGNHELAWLKTHDVDLEGALEDAGAVVLNNEYRDILVNNQSVRIGGYMGYYRFPGMMDSGRSLEEDNEFFSDFEDTTSLKLLVNHIPTSWLDWGHNNDFPVDMVFSGHYHGGIANIPIINRGLYAPYVGILPKHTRGMFKGDKATVILSAGLGDEYHLPRYNNPPELVVVKLNSK